MENTKRINVSQQIYDFNVDEAGPLNEIAEWDCRMKSLRSVETLAHTPLCMVHHKFTMIVNNIMLHIQPKTRVKFYRSFIGP